MTKKGWSPLERTFLTIKVYLAEPSFTIQQFYVNENVLLTNCNYSCRCGNSMVFPNLLVRLNLSNTASNLSVYNL